MIVSAFAMIFVMFSVVIFPRVFVLAHRTLTATSSGRVSNGVTVYRPVFALFWGGHTTGAKSQKMGPPHLIY